MSDASDYLENLILNTHLAGPSVPWLALYTSATLDSGSGTEVTGLSYSRQLITMGSGSAGISVSTSTVSFVNMPVATITNAALVTESNGGSFLVHAGITAPITTASGDTVTFTAGDVTVTVT